MQKNTALVPVAPFRALIKKRLAQLRQDPTEIGSVVGVAQELELTDRIVYRILSESNNIDFRLADLIVTRLAGPMHWHEDDELSEIYWSVNLFREDLVNPLENPGAVAWADGKALEAWDSSATRKEAAAKLGLSPTSFTRILDPALRRAGRGLSKQSIARRGPVKSECVRGHDISVWGRNQDGACRGCRADDHRRRRAEKETADA